MPVPTPRTDPQLRHLDSEIPRLHQKIQDSVRQHRGMDESRSSTRSRSPLRRKSSSESSPRDGSPVDFSVALDTAENVRDKSLSDEEDEEGSSRKVSSAQYQAVTSSKGSYKLNPAKSRRAARASLLDLGEGEVTDSVVVGPALTCGHHDIDSSHRTRP